MNRIKMSADERALRSKVIRLAHQNPELRPHLLPLLKTAADEGLEAGRTWGNPKPGAPRDDSPPGKKYHSHRDKPGFPGTKDRAKYNRWFQKTVCPKHNTKCGDPGRNWEDVVV